MLAEYADVRFDGPPGAYGTTPYPKRYVAIHNTANDASDSAEADYAEHRADHVSSHYYVDADSITQSLRTEYGANHAGSTIGNRHAIAYEITGTNAKSRTWWLANVAWGVLARQIARDCRKHNIAPRLLTVAQMRDGTTTGLVTHDLMRQAWDGTTHTDPGPGFPMDHLIALVAAEMEEDMSDATDVWAVKWGSETATQRLLMASRAAKPADVAAAVSPLQSKLDGLVTTVQALAAAVNAGGGNIDTTAILKRIDDRAVEDAARDAAHAAEVDQLQAEVHRLTVALAKAGEAQAALDDQPAGS